MSMNNASFEEEFEERFNQAKRSIEQTKREIAEFTVAFEERFNQAKRSIENTRCEIEELSGDTPCTETPDSVINEIDNKRAAWLSGERPAQLSLDAQPLGAVHEHSHMQMMQNHQQANQIMLQQQMLLQQQMNNQ